MKPLLILLAAAAIGMANPPEPPEPSAASIEEEEELKTEEAVFGLELDEDMPPAVDPAAWADTTLLMGSTAWPEGRYTDLTDDDYREVADSLGIEIATIKAVVDIEAGKKHEGFWQPGKPLVNFDLSMYCRFAPRRGVSLKKLRKSNPVIFSAPNVRKYGSRQAGQYARLEAAYAVDSVSAIEGTFWGMFQIGGFNWRKCGTADIIEFVRLMSRSERDQLDLFAKFITNSGMLDDLRNKRWLAFARKYNGPKARQRGYHTRLAAAYKKYSKNNK